MTLNSNKLPQSGGKFEPMEPGTYPARLVQIVDLGTQKQAPWQGEEKPPVNKIALTYEFVDEFMKDEDGHPQEDKPRWLTETMPFYSIEAERAKSSQRYKALDPKGTHHGDFSKLLDTPILVTVVHNPNKKTGGVYENIGEVSAMREKDMEKCPPLINGARQFDMDSPDIEVWQQLHKFIQDMITESLDFEGSAIQALVQGAPNQAASQDTETEEEDGDNPY